MKLIYVASPYSGDVKQNIEYAKRACRNVLDCGHAFFAPHLLYPALLDDCDSEQRKQGTDMGLTVLARCDELWVYGSRVSEGMASEICEAHRLEIPVRYIELNHEMMAVNEVVHPTMV